jgi:tetratricopeptide (TPR) repeat protein
MIRLLEGISGMWIPGKIDGSPAPLKKKVTLTFTPDPSYDLLQIAKTHMDNGNRELFEKENPKRALGHYNKAVTLLPYEKNLLLLRSLCNFELGQMDEARRDWGRIVNLNLGDRSQLETGYIIVKMQELEGYEELQRALAVQ